MQKLQKQIGIALVSTSLFSGIAGAGIAYNITPRQNVVKIIEKQTKVEVPAEPVNACNDGQSGEVASVFTEKLDTSKREGNTPGAWTWESTVVFTGGTICLIEGPDLSKVLRPGMKYKPTSGKQT